MDNIKLRVTFSKKDRARYISHLDLNRTMQRAFKRANIPVWYTEGFNPHAYIMFPLALSLGVESECEIMDFNITEQMDFDVIKSRLNSVLPQGLQIIKVAVQEQKHTAIALSEYKLCIKGDMETPELNESFDEFLKSDKIEIEKKTKKKGINLIDIKPYINIIEKEISDTGLELVIHLPAGTQTNINPSLVIEAFENISKLQVEIVNIERTKILTDDLKIFC